MGLGKYKSSRNIVTSRKFLWALSNVFVKGRHSSLNIWIWNIASNSQKTEASSRDCFDIGRTNTRWNRSDTWSLLQIFLFYLGHIDTGGWQAAGATQPMHWFLGGKALGIQQGTSVWIGSPNWWQTQFRNSILSPHLYLTMIEDDELHLLRYKERLSEIRSDLMCRNPR